MPFCAPIHPGRERRALEAGQAVGTGEEVDGCIDEVASGCQAVGNLLGLEERDLGRKASSFGSRSVVTKVAPICRSSACARALGLDLHPLRSSTHASLPACVLPARERVRRSDYRIGERETGYEDPARPFVKAARCRGCRETERCLGVPQPYARAFGLDELRPI